jgi:hypothetical protein
MNRKLAQGIINAIALSLLALLIAFMCYKFVTLGAI